MISSSNRQRQPSAAVTALGIDHVRLSYVYLDTGDLDAYASLLDEDIQVKRPDAPAGHGRAEVLKLHAAIAGPPGRHRLYKVIADGDSIAAIGRFTGPPALTVHYGQIDVEFADFFTISDEGLLLGYRRFYYLPPG